MSRSSLGGAVEAPRSSVKWAGVGSASEGVAQSPSETMNAATLRHLGTLEFLGIRAIGRHGVLLQEQVRAQPFEVDLHLVADLAAAAASDNLEDTVDYPLVVVAVARIIELESYRLLERLADRIAGVCISLTAVTAVEVTVRKLKPPFPVHVTSMAVTIRRDASEDGSLILASSAACAREPKAAPGPAGTVRT